jgi:hypothetical protein
MLTYDSFTGMIQGLTYFLPDSHTRFRIAKVVFPYESFIFIHVSSLGKWLRNMDSQADTAAKQKIQQCF